MEFESVRVLKEMRNNVNRVVNCETSQLQKTVDAAIGQIRDIERLQASGDMGNCRLNCERPPDTVGKSEATLGEWLNVRHIQ